MKNLGCVVMLCLPGAALADGFCNVTDPVQIAERLAGDWSREGAMSIENAGTSALEPSTDYKVTFNADFTVATEFFEQLTGRAHPWDLADPKLYDVDGVDDMLDTTERTDLADILSDTKCGPGALPQMVVHLTESHLDMEVAGTSVFIPYFDDRILEVTELTLKMDETVLFVTETVLLTPTTE
ncbi:MAG: hypothetical protein ACRBB0_07590 [Pelagimonas sp.]|uniref:hypothetical protein n=1 Tax=Pelagimonas sp. TaxID=2073170 RepID=UPI003D6BE20B